MRVLVYAAGDIVNGLVFVRETSPQVSNSRKSRRAMFRCRCGQEFDVIIRSVVSGNTTSCGCWGTTSRSIRFSTHGLRQHSLYSLWGTIKTRCYNAAHSDYRFYGGRGISMSDEFRTDFSTFYTYVSELPDYGDRSARGLTLDRIDNSKNYERGNLRWATRKEQANNRRPYRRG